MLVDAHAHLHEYSLANFMDVLSSSISNLTVISNSVDVESSIRTIAIGKKTKKVIPFVGIHPDIFKNQLEGDSEEAIRTRVEAIQEIAPFSSGIGEIGIDPKYGSLEYQERLFTSLLGTCEKTRLPVSIHSRDSVQKILPILTTFSLTGSILFHWFAGSESELKQIKDRGYYVSYGPSILYSKRMATLVEKSSPDRILSETDSPTPFSSLTKGISTPYLVASVVFKIGLITKTNFEQTKQMLHLNVLRYLGTQNSLRVK